MKQYIQLNIIILGDMLHNFAQLFVLHKLTLQKTSQPGEDIKTFTFTSNKKLRYEAGQYGIWILKKIIWGKPARLFTVASPAEDNTIELSTRISKSDFKQKLNRLRVGDTMYMIGPVGRFTIPAKVPRSIVMVAGGIGITPFHSIAKSIYDHQLPLRTTLVHSAHDFYLYKEEMEKYVTTAHFVGRETQQDTLASVVHIEDDDTVYYVSGPPPFVAAATAQLHELGVTNIKIDGFLGYKK